jgi:hypothetical protein
LLVERCAMDVPLVVSLKSAVLFIGSPRALVVSIALWDWVWLDLDELPPLEGGVVVDPPPPPQAASVIAVARASNKGVRMGVFLIVLVKGLAAQRSPSIRTLSRTVH